MNTNRCLLPLPNIRQSPTTTPRPSPTRLIPTPRPSPTRPSPTHRRPSPTRPQIPTLLSPTRPQIPTAPSPNTGRENLILPEEPDPVGVYLRRRTGPEYLENLGAIPERIPDPDIMRERIRDPSVTRERIPDPERACFRVAWMKAASTIPPPR